MTDNVVRNSLKFLLEQDSTVSEIHSEACDCSDCVLGSTSPVDATDAATWARFISGGVLNRSGLPDAHVRRIALSVVRKALGYPYTPGETCEVWNSKGHRGHHWSPADLGNNRFICACGAKYEDGVLV